jgi:putative inorganic carbon (HCO3(-)) transporter
MRSPAKGLTPERDLTATAARSTLFLGAFLLPLVVVGPAADPDILPKLLAARLLVLILAALWVVRIALTRELRVQCTPLAIPLAVFLVSAAVSTVLAVNTNLALFGAYTRYEGLLTLCTYAALFWLATQTLRDERDARTLVVALLGSAYVVSVIAIVQAVAGSVLGIDDGGDTALSFGGLSRATGTFGNANTVAAFLAMLLPLALHRLFEATSWPRRALAANAVIVPACALFLTFGRAAWIGAALGCALVLWHQIHARPRRFVAAAIGAAGAVALVAISLLGRGGLSITRSVLARLSSVADVSGGSSGTRLHIWSDSIALLRARPLTGWGPDTFGLVYPRYQTGRWTPGFVIDKAHSDVVQIAATQGLLGVVSYLWVLLAAVRCWWRGRRRRDATALLGGLLAYEITVQVNFSWVPASLPFWLLLAAAVIAWTGTPRSVGVQVHPRKAIRLPAVAIAVGALAWLVPATVVRPLAADVWYQRALTAGDSGNLGDARADIAQARADAPWEAQYAAEAGDLADDLTAGDLPGPHADDPTAGGAYSDAVALGTTDANVLRHLGGVELRLHRVAEAQTAAQAAVVLDRYDVRNTRLLAQTTQAATTSPSR